METLNNGETGLQIRTKINSNFTELLNRSGLIAGLFTTVLPTASIATDKLYAYAGVDNTVIGGITWRNGDFAWYNGTIWTRIPFQALTNYLLKTEADIFDQRIANYSTIEGYYLSPTGVKTSSGVYRIYVYAVTPNDKLRITVKSTGAMATYAFYSDAACTTLIKLGYVKTINEGYTVDETFIVPVGAAYLAIPVYPALAGGFYQNIYTYRSAFSALADFGAKIYGDYKINAIGDSLVAGYFSLLNAAVSPKYSLENLAVSGENSLTISGRIGAIAMKFKNSFTLPSTTATVQVGTLADSGLLSSYDESNVTPLQQGVTSLQVYVDGILCTLSYTSSIYYLARVVAGSAIRTIAAGTFLNPYTSIRNKKANVIHIGTNGGWGDVSTTLIDQINKVIRFSNNENSIVVGLHYRAGFVKANFESLEAAMEKEFGNRFVNVRKYMITNALSDAGLTATGADNTAIAAGLVPPQLLIDGVHFTATGYGLLVALITSRMTLLNMI